MRGKAEIVDNLVSNMGFDLESALKGNRQPDPNVDSALKKR